MDMNLLLFVALAVVQDVRAMRIPDRTRADRRTPHDLKRLVVDRDEDVHRGVRWWGRSLAAALHPPDRRREEIAVDERVGLGHDQCDRLHVEVDPVRLQWAERLVLLLLRARR